MGIRLLKALLLLLTTVQQVQASTSTISEPPPIGNFSLPVSQQPAPLYSFGQNIINKGTAQLFLTPDGARSSTSHYSELSASFLYALSDEASLLFTAPYLLNNTDERVHSSGYSDTDIQGEYAFYNDSKSDHTTQATVLGGITFPTGDLHKIPPTGYGCPTYFIGGTYNLMFVNWLWFASAGVQPAADTEHIHYKTQSFYQSGVGRVLSSQSKEYIFLGLLELDGQTNGANRVLRFTRPGTSGNILYATPSLWFSTKNLIFQLGISLPVTQHTSGSQSKTDYYASGILGWTIG